MMAQINKEALAKFPRGVLRLPLPVRIWLGVLLFANAVMPLFFLGNREARVTLLIFVLSVGFMMTLTHVVGFNRLLGVGYILWIPLLLYLWRLMGGHPAIEPYGAWIRILMLLDAAALVLAGWDVARWVRGERGDL